MVRVLLGSMASLALVFVVTSGLVHADNPAKDTPAKDTTATKDKKYDKATIANVDAKKGTITLKVKDKSGKDTEKTFKLTEDATYWDSEGKVVKIDVFQSGDEILFLEADGKIKEVKKDKKGSTTGSTDRKDK